MKPYYEDALVTLYHGDALDVLPLVGRPVDLTLTDPPYNVGLDYSEGDDRTDYAEWTAAWLAAVPRPLVVTPGMVNLAMWFGIETPTWTCAWVKPNQVSPSPTKSARPASVGSMHGSRFWSTASRRSGSGRTLGR